MNILFYRYLKKGNDKMNNLTYPEIQDIVNGYFRTRITKKELAIMFNVSPNTIRYIIDDYLLSHL